MLRAALRWLGFGGADYHGHGHDHGAQPHGHHGH
jgi:hypothetical protein